ncbi:MAG: indolepyruvate/phenylpyruvate decarboxylase, partial [Gammaproteobacteria bacterium]|nr:indolepyruvate/phenylpyruvate decarboxylase [Gammaproteobacteria bacterium]
DQVFVECAPFDPAALTATPPFDPEALAACVDEIMARLAGASSPVLLVGIETRRFGVEQEAGELAARLGVPVTTTFMGRGLLASIGAEFAGSYMGVAGDDAVTNMVESSDALVLLGVLLSDTNFGISARNIDMRKAVLICDGQVSIGFHTYPNMPLAEVVREMHRRVAGRELPAPTALRERYPYGLQADNEPITPADIATAINDVFEELGPMPIAADMGDCLFTAFSIENTELVAPGYYATMGYGVPAGIGVEVATGRRPLVLVGDGAFQMTGWELLNCRRYGLSPVVIVFNNASWEMLRAFQPESSFNDLDTLDFRAIARSLGGEGYQATTRAELQAALREALGRTDTFQLIDARIPRGVLSPTLQRFVDGFKRMRAGAGT